MNTFSLLYLVVVFCVYESYVKTKVVIYKWVTAALNLGQEILLIGQ